MSIAWETGGECVLAHNGTINNASALRELIEDAGGLFSSNSDTEVILQILSSKVRHGLKKAIIKTASLLQGSYSLVAMVQGKIIGVRDPFGIRPLVIGKFSDDSYIISSETCALDVVGAEYIRDVKAGEIIIIDGEKEMSNYQHQSLLPVFRVTYD
jgi:amidophosphoribosyltransferase